MSGRVSYLAAIQATEGRVFTPIDIARNTQNSPGKVRVWLSRDRKSGIVESQEEGKYRIVSVEKVSSEISKIQRNSATKGSSKGGRRDLRSAQLCRLHAIEYKARLVGESRESLQRKLEGWKHNLSSGADHYWMKNLPLPGLGCNGTYHIAVGNKRATLQLFIDPLWSNSWKLFDQLEAIHQTAQLALKVLAYEHKIQVALLEVSREGHFAISIPAKEGWKLSKIGYKKKTGGKIWVTEDWFIDESYGAELETMRAQAFGDLMTGLQKVGSIDDKLTSIEARLAKMGLGEPITRPVPESTGQEIQ